MSRGLATTTRAGEYARLLRPWKVGLELRAAQLAVHGAMGAYRLQRRGLLREAAGSPRGKPVFLLAPPKRAQTAAAIESV